MAVRRFALLPAMIIVLIASSAKERWRCHCPVAHGPEPLGAAARHGRGNVSDGRHDDAFAQQGRRALFVGAVKIEGEGVRQGSKRGQQPGAQRVGVDGEGEAPRTCRAWSALELSRSLGCQQLDLPGQAQQRLAGGCGPDWPAADQDHLSGVPLECLYPLTHGGRGDVQPPGGGFETAPRHGCTERLQLSEIRLDKQRC